ncbi:A24 family peptidase [Vibrio sp. SS-MA-C1-2]|uniref:prepilin peptidase n=1 Tax=Vibrio sp. SS-MA-C1-2 TaxID=2908646 RepID=UPI001F300720|nr:A24 family peptidase [Vibrio sp. SS-MA-C1-2]UJF19621.1 A24 family peptidase [Vibrio sp. SS-MA-C1-2]
MELLILHPWLTICFVALFSLIMGSFLNVVIYRLPIMMENQWQSECHVSFPEANIPAPEKQLFNLSLPASHCRQCQTPVRWFDNIPLFSWLLLKGQCRHCQKKISIRYPFIELLTTVIGIVTFLAFPPSIWSASLLFFSFTLIVLSFIDLDTLLLPDNLTLPLMWGGITLSLLNISPVSLNDAIFGAIFGYGFLWSLYWLFKLLTGKEGMGYGDFKLLAALGAWLGWQQLPFILLVASISGVIFGLIELKILRSRQGTQFPFGPYLAFSGWICLVAGDQITHWYLLSFWGL